MSNAISVFVSLYQKARNEIRLVDYENVNTTFLKVESVVERLSSIGDLLEELLPSESHYFVVVEHELGSHGRTDRIPVL